MPSGVLDVAVATTAPLSTLRVWGLEVAWLVAVLLGFVLLTVIGLRSNAPGAADHVMLRRQLAAARRRGSPIALLLARASGTSPRAVESAMRVSDFVIVRSRRGGTVELSGVLDAEGLDPHGVESRLRAELGGAWRFAWARFPEEGATFDALAHTARHRLTADHPRTLSPLDGG